MNNRCCFAGHSKISNTDEIYSKLSDAIEKLIISENVTEFLVGNYGSFDKLCAGAVRKLKEKYPQIQLNLVIPYVTKEINENKEQYYKKFNNILMADIPERTPARLRILKCNEYMIMNSGFLICFVHNTWGGAATTLEFAKTKKHIKIFNLAHMQDEGGM